MKQIIVMMLLGAAAFGEIEPGKLGPKQFSGIGEKVAKKISGGTVRAPSVSSSATG